MRCSRSVPSGAECHDDIRWLENPDGEAAVTLAPELSYGGPLGRRVVVESMGDQLQTPLLCWECSSVRERWNENSASIGYKDF